MTTKPTDNKPADTNTGEDVEKNDQNTGGEFTPPATKADLDALLAAELAKFADYDELATKAAKYDEAQAANMTELEKAQAAAREAEKRAADLEAKATRAEVAAAKGVPADLLTGSTKAELEAAADRLLAFKGNPPKAAPPSGSGGPIHQAPGKTGDWLRDSLSAR